MTNIRHPLPPLILASTSTYRRDLLKRLGLPFTAHDPQVTEEAIPHESPSDLAQRLALTKAQAVATRHTEAIVIGSDQVAELHGQAMGKPGTHARAVEQLRRMSGNLIAFHTAVAVVHHAQGFAQVELSHVEVQCRELSDQEIEHYLRLEQPYDCAGSAKVESLGIALLSSVSSTDPTALIGLPLIQTCTLLRQVGVDPILHSTGDFS